MLRRVTAMDYLLEIDERGGTRSTMMGHNSGNIRPIDRPESWKSTRIRNSSALLATLIINSKTIGGELNRETFGWVPIGRRDRIGFNAAN